MDRVDKEFKLAILASGEGSTGEAIFDIASLVVVSNPEAGIIKRVENFIRLKNKNLKVIVLDRSRYQSREEFGKALLKILKDHKINFISQNGWTVYTPENVLTEYEGRIINSHPGPLDAPYADFGGAKMNDLVVHAAAIHFFNNVLRPFKTEINLHFVTKDFDKGEVVARREVEVYPADTPRILQQRVKVAERELLRVFWKRISLSQKIKPIKRDERVIKEGEEKSLEEAKRQAIKKWSTPPSVRS